MGDDGRLELDDDGLPLDSRAAHLALDDEPVRPSRAGRVLDAALTGPTRGSTIARRALAVALVTSLALALVIATRPRLPTPVAADVVLVPIWTVALVPPAPMAISASSRFTALPCIAIRIMQPDAQPRRVSNSRHFMRFPVCRRLRRTC